MKGICKGFWGQTALAKTSFKFLSLSVCSPAVKTMPSGMFPTTPPFPLLSTLLRLSINLFLTLSFCLILGFLAPKGQGTVESSSAVGVLTPTADDEPLWRSLFSLASVWDRDGGCVRVVMGVVLETILRGGPPQSLFNSALWLGQGSSFSLALSSSYSPVLSLACVVFVFFFDIVVYCVCVSWVLTVGGGGFWVLSKDLVVFFLIVFWVDDASKTKTVLVLWS
jgi:hypothetical protein